MVRIFFVVSSWILRLSRSPGFSWKSYRLGTYQHCIWVRGQHIH